ncbi:MAG TPA: hypothetical protein PKD91_02855 [Bacteroidia bacterium]|nr:hypothetical protein [Bacteroidia bacterium]
METKSFKDKLGKLITKAETELDELRVKISLGKMNGADLFEDMKKELRESFHEISGELKSESKEIAESVKSNIEELQLQLALGKAEALDAYEEQKSKINKSINSIEHDIRNTKNELSYDARLKIQNELEKFRLKMEVLQIRYELGRLDLKDNVETKKQKFKKEFDQLLDTLKEETSEKVEEYGENLKNAYDALRKSLQS